MAKHTPGPWKVGRCDGDGVRVVRGDGFSCPPTTLAFLGPDCADTRNRPCVSNEVKANAHLIAAAPDLLEALERLAKCNVPDGLKEQAHAAIKKARGE